MSSYFKHSIAPSPILPLIVLSTLPLRESCLTLSFVMTFIIITFTLDTSISYLRFILYRHLKIFSLSISILASYFTYFSLGRIHFFVACKFLTLSFVVFLFVISFTILITLPCLVITLCLLSKIFSLLSQFESGVLLISPLAISSSSPRVSLDVTPFFYCTYTTGSSVPSSFLLCPCLLSPLTLAIFMSFT
jgi:hypothetical protein